MKKLLILSFLFLTLSACDKIDQEVQFSTDYTATFKIPADQPAGTPLSLEEVELNVDDRIFENNHASKDLLEEVRLKKIKLEINPQLNNNVSQLNLDFLTDAALYIEADNLPKVRIAWINDLTDQQSQSIELNFLSDNLSDYFKKEAFKLFLIVSTDQVLNQKVFIDVQITADFNTKILGR